MKHELDAIEKQRDKIVEKQQERFANTRTLFIDTFVFLYRPGTLTSSPRCYAVPMAILIEFTMEHADQTRNGEGL